MRPTMREVVDQVDGDIFLAIFWLDDDARGDFDKFVEKKKITKKSLYAPPIWPPISAYFVCCSMSVLMYLFICSLDGLLAGFVFKRYEN